MQIAVMKSALLIALTLVACSALAGDSLSWTFAPEANLTFTLNSFSESWKGKEAGSIIWVANASVLATKKLGHNLQSDNSLKLAFGQTKTQNKDTKKWSAPWNSTDFFDLQSMLKLKMGTKGNDLFVSAKMLSQFYDNRDPLNIRLANPSTLTATFGLSKDLLKQPSLQWSMRAGAALRSNIDRDTLHFELIEGIKNYTGHHGTSVINDAGTELVSEYKMKRADWMTLSGKLTLYEAIMRPLAPQTSDWRYPDLSFEQKVSINVTKYLIINYLLQLYYDRELHPDPRYRQTLSAGFTLLSSK